ncbi:endoribonuclease Dicer homolog 2 isoform X2 [Morus notabilis]|nr:endoribonuclease Dicer homolog 2 isoform X2 [Morus notabilis]
MEPVNMDMERAQQLSADPLPFARSYQLEALESGIKQNTIVFLETGSGKTLIAIMLLRSYAHLLRKPSPFISVFLVPQVVLVPQQAKALEMHTDLKVGTYWGEKGVDNWDANMWNVELEKHEVLVMTPQILLNNLRHSFFKLSMIKVLIVDECHHARGNHPYASIMSEFYHRQLRSGVTDLPRIFGMTASPIKSKVGKAEIAFWVHIQELETLMNSKVYTCASESVIAEFIPISTPKFRYYRHEEITDDCFVSLADQLKSLQEKHELSLEKLDLDKSAAESISKKLMKVYSALLFCLDELGVWLAMKAALSFSCNEIEFLSWGKVDVFGEAIVKKFSLDAFNAFKNSLPTDPNWSIINDVKLNMSTGLLTAKVFCLIELLLEYRHLKDLRCIVFVQRIVTAVVIQSLLSELLPKRINWKAKYIAGSSNNMQSQTRKKQNEIVGEFREGVVNIIVATSILEEGLDVQSCNLVVRFDPSSTVCSFIQSRGRARKKNSDYVLMIESGDHSTQSRLKNYLASGEIMRKESLRHASLPCEPLDSDLQEGDFYCVESTGAIMTLSSSINLIYFYCSRLPSDGYFKPTPRWDLNTGTLYLPKSCPIQAVSAEGNPKILKQIACLEACKQLHQIGALTDNLVPDIVVEEDNAKELASQPYKDEQPSYVPSEMVGSFGPADAGVSYHCYLIELKQDFGYDVPIHDLVLCMRSALESDLANIHFDLQVGRGSVTVNLKNVGTLSLNRDQVTWSRMFQVTLLRLLVDHKFDNLREVHSQLYFSETIQIDYLLLPAITMNKRPLIDWKSVTSVLFSSEEFCKDHMSCPLPKGISRCIHTKNGIVCTCMLRNSLVYTPHSESVYCVTGILEKMNGKSRLDLTDGTCTTYRKYFKEKHGINLQFCNEPLFRGRRLFRVKNYLLHREAREKESSNITDELPPELCYIIMSPISPSTLYSFSFFPSIMHQIEGLLIAASLKRMHLDHCVQNVNIPTVKVLEAITTKKCQEKFHLESLETLGDSFLKYAVGQHLFKTYQNNHEGLLSVKKDKIISNAALCKFGCERKLPGFIRDEYFDPKNWIIPGDSSTNKALLEDVLPNEKIIYIKGTKKMKSKRVADVVEALIGAFLSTGGEIPAVKFMNWLGIEVDLEFKPYETHFQVQSDRLLNIKHLEFLLNYTFRDRSLLVEALTHGSYMLPEIPRCYQRLEFLGDAVLDYVITMHFYNTYPGMSPEKLTDMRSASVNNDCYALSAVKAGLQKHILYTSHQLHKEIANTIINFEKLSSESTFGWESETSFPKVLGDVIESLAGAIFVDSGYDKELVFQSIRPLLEPLITPETVKLHPAKELNELCQKMHFDMKKPVKSRENGVSSITIEVEANGVTYRHTSNVSDKKIGKKVACKEVLEALKRALSLK